MKTRPGCGCEIGWWACDHDGGFKDCGCCRLCGAQPWWSKRGDRSTVEHLPTQTGDARSTRAPRSMSIRPCELKDANAFVASHHRHHKPVVGHRFSVGAWADDRLVGVAIIGRPVARMVDARTTLEVTRLCTDGTTNACSLLYATAARVGKALGYTRIQTYILESEPGTSLRAAGWIDEGAAGGGQWKHTDGKPRREDQPIVSKRRFAKTLA